MPRVALCADDYGYRPGVSATIRALVRAERLTATSALVTFPDWAAASAHVAELREKADVGLHLNLVEGPPLGAMPITAGMGQMPTIGALVRRALLGSIDAAEIRGETLRQIEAFERATGRLPDFLDGHQHAHALPGVRDAVLSALTEVDPQRLIVVRDPSDQWQRILRRGVAVPKALAIAALASGFASLLRRTARAHNDGFSGVYDFGLDGDFDGAFRRFIAAPGTRHLVVCHPGMPEDAATVDPIAGARQREARYLAKDSFLETCAQAKVELVRFTTLVA